MHLAPLPHCKLHGPLPQLSVQVDPSAQFALQASLAEHVKAHFAPDGHAQSCPGVHVSEVGPPDDELEEVAPLEEELEEVAPLEEELEEVAPLDELEEELALPDDPDDDELVPPPIVVLEHAAAERIEETRAKKKRIFVMDVSLREPRRSNPHASPKARGNARDAYAHSDRAAIDSIRRRRSI